VGSSGRFSFLGISLVVGSTAAAPANSQYGAITGSGTIYINGGYLRLGSTPFIGDQSPDPPISVIFNSCSVSAHATSPAAPVFALTNQQMTVTSVNDYAGGGLIVPSLTYTYVGSNVETYLGSLALWPGLTIYSSAYRAYKNVTTAINIA